MVKPKKHKSRIRQRKPRRKMGSRCYRNYTEEMLEIACELVAANNLSSRDAERQFGIPRRTIINKCKNKHTKAIGRPTALTVQEEKKIVRVLQASSEFGSPLTKIDLKLVVHEFLKKNSRENIFNNKLPGDAWVNSFLARHADELCLRSTQNISKARSDKGPEEIAQYFENLGQTLNGIPPENIINFDETNLSDDPGSVKGIFRRGVKHPERIVNSTKGNISLMYTATASGQLLPLYVVYKASNKYSEWVNGGPPNTRYNCTKSGWFDSAMFEDYFEQIILPWAQRTPGTKVVICDNLSSHLNIKVVELCDENDIKFVFIPPRSTHLTQPLDVAFFAPLKKAWRKILLGYKIKNPTQTSLNKKHFPKLLTELMEAIKLNEENNIKSGFKATGVVPFNPREVLKKIPEMQETILAYGIDQALLDYLKEYRAPNPLRVQRNKKITCEPGQSVTASDITVGHNKNARDSSKRKKLIKNTSSTVVQKEHGCTFLDEQTGLFTDSYTQSIDEDQDCFLDETERVTHNEAACSTVITRNAERLSMLCIKVINTYLGTDHQIITYTPAKVVREIPLVRASTSRITKNPSKNSGRVKVLSNVLVNVEPHASNVTFLSTVSNKKENTRFMATCQSDLPECLTVNNEVALKKLIVVNSAKKAMFSKANIKQENPSKTESDDMNSVPKLNFCNSDLGHQQARKTKPGQKVKKDKTEKKGKKCNRKDTKKKGTVNKNKTKNTKKRTKRFNSKSSSTTINSSVELVTADSDNSNYETMHDYYIAECLKEQEDKENIEKNEIPFGLHDIKYFSQESSDLQENDWIIAQFSTKKSLKHFVGKVLSINGTIPKVKFARKVKNSKCKTGTTFTYPAVDDICTLPNPEDVITVLPQPTVTRRGQFIFEVDFQNFNIQ